MRVVIRLLATQCRGRWGYDITFEETHDDVTRECEVDDLLIVEIRFWRNANKFATDCNEDGTRLKLTIVLVRILREHGQV